MPIGFYNAFGKYHKQLEKAVVESKNEIFVFDQNFQISIFSWDNFNAISPLILIKLFFDIEPFVFKLLVEFSDLIY